jgi:excinuclease ABC subunit B
MSVFNLQSDYSPAGDQPKAIEQLLNGVKDKDQFQTLMGVTGSGKTYTVANVIQKLGKKTLILTHNKTLAAQLYQEFKEFFPTNAVEYFVSYYDYYQPEAYVVSSDTFIEKESSINDEIDKLRIRATTSLLTRKDVIVVASVSCIYGLGNPKDFYDMMLHLNVGQEIGRKEIVKHLVDTQYTRNDLEVGRSCFRVRGDVIEVHPAYEDFLYRIEMWGDEIEVLSRVDAVTGQRIETLDEIFIAPARHFVSQGDNSKRMVDDIREELEARLEYFKEKGKLLEAQRLETRVRNDMDMLSETGFCNGIENYSRIVEDREPGSRPYTLLDFFGDDWLMCIDESHVSVPQIGGMFGGDRSRKTNLVEYGFRLPSALDNRPMNFDEFEANYPPQIVYVSATPGDYELKKSGGVVVEQIIRPTGLLDPVIELHPIEGQMDLLIEEIKKVTARDERVLVTTLTKKMSEDLTDYFISMGIRVRYLHSDINTVERSEILKELRQGVFDVLIGINLLREGLDLPEVSLVAILDADKEGFLRSYRSLIQTMGRAARNQNGKVMLFADRMTDSMKKAIDETNRRREFQEEHNKANGITPLTVKRKIEEDLRIVDVDSEVDDEPLFSEEDVAAEVQTDYTEDLTEGEIEQRMHKAAAEMNFEEAAKWRDRLMAIKKGQ